MAASRTSVDELRAMAKATFTTSTGYQGFGSFHSDNVEDMLAAPDDVYEPPTAPAGLGAEELVDEAAAEVSKRASASDLYTPGDTLRAWFPVCDTDWLFVNHGAFGAASSLALHAAAAWSRYGETQPLRFIDRELFPHTVASIRAMARVLRAPARNIVFIPHATYGLNACIRAADVRAGQTVFMLDIGYGSVKKMLMCTCEAVGARLVMAHIRFPLADEQDLLQQVSAAMPACVDLAVFDHVTSNTAVAMPVAALVRMARDRGARVIVDGAHGLQSLDLDVPAIGAEWYVTNCHKWFCSTKGVGVLYAAPSVRDATRALIVSHGYGAGFTSEFIWDGCRDYSGVLSIPAQLAWWRRVGPERAREHCKALLASGVELCTRAWGTDTHAPMSMYSHMACVRLPDSAVPPLHAPGPHTSTHAKMVQDALHFGAHTEVPVKCLEGRLYLRVSAAVYGTVRDFERLARIVAGMRWIPGEQTDGQAGDAACTVVFTEL